MRKVCYPEYDKKSPIIKRWQDEKIPCHKTLAKVESKEIAKNCKRYFLLEYHNVKRWKSGCKFETSLINLYKKLRAFKFLPALLRGAPSKLQSHQLTTIRRKDRNVSGLGLILKGLKNHGILHNLKLICNYGKVCYLKAVADIDASRIVFFIIVVIIVIFEDYWFSLISFWISVETEDKLWRLWIFWVDLVNAENVNLVD